MRLNTPIMTLDSDESMGILALIGLILLALLVSYLFACLTLYAFVELTGMLEFSWINGLWVLILMLATIMCFKGGK